MRSHPRIRKTVKWGSATAAVVVLVAGAFSAWGEWFASFDWPIAHGFDEIEIDLVQSRVTLLVSGQANYCAQYPDEFPTPTSTHFYHGLRPQGGVHLTDYYWLWLWGFNASWNSSDMMLPDREMWGIGFYLATPLWAPLLIFGGTSAWMFWRDRSFGPGRCQSCGFDLAGLPEIGVCPECGSPMVVAGA